MYTKKACLFICIFCISIMVFPIQSHEIGMGLIKNIKQRWIEQAVNETLQKIESNKGKSNYYADDDLYGLTSIQRAIVEDSTTITRPETMFQKIWTLFTCIDMLSTNVASLPFDLFKRGTDITIEKNPILDAIKGKANENMTGYELIERSAMHLLLRGNSYCYHIGTPKLILGLYPLLAQNVRPHVSERDKTKIVYYRDTSYGGKRDYKPEEIIHIKLINPENVVEGQSPLKSGSKPVDFIEKLQEYKTNIYDNQGRPGGLLSSPMEIDEKDRGILRKEIEKYTGPKNAGKTLILSHGMKWEQMSLSPEDLNLIASEETTCASIVTMYKIPIELFGNLAKQKNYANMREATRHFYKFAIFPLAKKIFSAFSLHFFPDMSAEFRILEDKIKDLRPTAEDLKDQHWLKWSEKRTLTGHPLPEKKDELELLNRYYAPMGLVPLDELGLKEEINPEEM